MSLMLHWFHPRAELSAYLDGQLDRRMRARVERRLARCAACRWELETLRQTVAVVRRLPAAPPPRSFALQPAMVHARSTARRPAASRSWLAIRPALAVAAAAILVLVAAGGQLWPLVPTGERGAAPVAVAPAAREAAPAVGQRAQPPIAPAPPAAEDAARAQKAIPPGVAPLAAAPAADVAAPAPAQGPADEPPVRALAPAAPASHAARPAAPAVPWPALAVALTLGALMALAVALWRRR